MGVGGATISPWMLISTGGKFKYKYTSTYVLCLCLMNVFKKMSSDCTSKTNMYIVLGKNYFHYCGSPTFPVPLNPNSTFPSEGNYCQRNRNSCQLP